MARALFALWLMLTPLTAWAEEIVLGLSDDQVAISATFEGKEILIFGAIRRDAGVNLDGKLGVIVTIAGPDEAIVVRRKDRRFGIWVNVEAVDIGTAPAFYALATSAPLAEILDPVEDEATRISLDRVIQGVGAAEGASQAFVDALIRIRQGDETYQVIEGAVQVDEETLFRTSISLPAALTEGDYTAEIYLTRDGAIVDVYSTTIPVEKVGLERWLFRLAHDQPFVYGIMSLAIAIFAGWAASAVFQLARR
ncbi:MAG: TIGR02186 family protein [Pseudomonadota bacterium]